VADRAPSHGTTSSTTAASTDKHNDDVSADADTEMASPALKKKTGRRFVRRAAVDSDDDSDDDAATTQQQQQQQQSKNVNDGASASTDVSSSDAPQVSRYGESLTAEEPSAPTTAASTATGASAAGVAAAAAGYKPASSATAAAATAAAESNANSSNNTSTTASKADAEPAVEYDDSAPLSDSETVQYEGGDQDPDVEEFHGRVTPAGGQPLARRSDSIGSILSRLENGTSAGAGGGGSSRMEPVTRPQAAFQPASTPQVCLMLSCCLRC
jgi:hypothetical protein